MNAKRIVCIVIVLIGIVMFGTSMYITDQVAQGRGQISSAQKKLDRGNTLFDMNPVSKEVGKVVTSGSQNKLDKYRTQADYYENLARWLKIGGILCIVVGGVFFFIGGRRR